jgi:hypothetical protein
MASFIAHSEGHFKLQVSIFPLAAIGCTPDRSMAPVPPIRSFKSTFPVSVAGEGVFGRCGPRTGNSSGVRPGNSSGGGGSPGSCIGVGTSGRGFPGGLSCGGSDGWPGLIGGPAGRSAFRAFWNFVSFDPEPTAPVHQCSSADMSNTYQHRIAAGPAGFGITARAHVGNAVL